jgi:hypothetical protein
MSGGVELRQIARDALFDLLAAALDLPLREVAVAIIDCVQAELGFAKTNLLPSIATLAVASNPISRHSSTK